MKYTLAEYRADVAALGLGASFDADDVQALWRARVRKAHPDGGGSEERTKALNVAKDRILAWIKAGRPAFPDAERQEQPRREETQQEKPREEKRNQPPPETPRPKRRFTWPASIPRPPLVFPSFKDCHRIFGVPAPLLFLGWGGLLLAVSAIGSIPFAALFSVFDFDFEGMLIGMIPTLLIWAGMARVAWLGHGKYKRDIVKECPKCKRRGVLRKVGTRYNYSDWHAHQTEVCHGKHAHKETVVNTMHHFSAFYKCEACAHEFQYDFKRFVMNNPSFDRPHDIVIGVLRMILQI